MPFREEAKPSVSWLRNVRSELAASQGVLFLLAWQLIAGKKRAKAPTPRLVAAQSLGRGRGVAAGWGF